MIEANSPKGSSRVQGIMKQNYKKPTLGNTRNTQENAGEKVKTVQYQTGKQREEHTDLNTQEGAG